MLQIICRNIKTFAFWFGGFIIFQVVMKKIGVWVQTNQNGSIFTEIVRSFAIFFYNLHLQYWRTVMDTHYLNHNVIVTVIHNNYFQLMLIIAKSTTRTVTWNIAVYVPSKPQNYCLCVGVGGGLLSGYCLHCSLFYRRFLTNREQQYPFCKGLNLFSCDV